MVNEMKLISNSKACPVTFVGGISLFRNTAAPCGAFIFMFVLVIVNQYKIVIYARNKIFPKEIPTIWQIIILVKI